MKRALLVTVLFSAGVVAVAMIFWVVIDRRAGAGWRETFEEFKRRTAPAYASFAPAAVDSATDAAPLYDDWIIDRQPRDAAFDAMRQRKPAEVTATEWSAAERFVDSQREVIERLIKAADLRSCRRPLAYDQGWNMLLPHTAASIVRADLLLWDVRLRLRSGESDGVWPRLRAISALGASMTDEPSMVCQLTRIVILNKALDGAEEAMALGPPPRGWDDRFDVAAMNRAIARAFAAEFTLVAGTQDAFLAGRPTSTELDHIGRFTRLKSRPRHYETSSRLLLLLAHALDVMAMNDLAKLERLPQIQEMIVKDPGPGSFLVVDLLRPWRNQRRLEARLLLAREAVSPSAVTPLDPLFRRPIERIAVGNGVVLRVAATPIELHAMWHIDAVIEWRMMQK